MRRAFFVAALVVLAINAVCAFVYPPVCWSMILFGPLIILGVRDALQTRHAVLRNFPVLGHFRYLFETIRPEINQYFIESDTDGRPFSREMRSLVYQRAKEVTDTVPFGTKEHVYDEGYEWVNHSLDPKHVDPETLRITIGGPDCTQPYTCSILNISAMSYGSLSSAAVKALNGGARIGGFAHNTGEGGISPHHLEKGGDLIWQIGTGYFGCRTAEGGFDPDLFAEGARQKSVKMIEIKLSQGAKPGHGGILPASKLTPELSAIRKVPMGKDVISPPAHTAFQGPEGLMRFVAQLRTLSGGKPVGFKLCVGKRREFFALCKAMLSTGITPDFITVDGAEGGTGAAPLEFSNHMGTPLAEGLILVHNGLVGIGVRDKVKVLSAGRVMTGFDLIKRLALGADACYSARAMMFALGCIQALRCNSNHCPVGVATQNPELVKGLHVGDKMQRVAHFHRNTVESAAEMVGAMGLHHSDDLRPWHVMRRVSPHEVHHYGELYDFLESGELLSAPVPDDYRRAWEAAQAGSFDHANPD
ncbi:MAG: FMN-binding glutamate synthase family protein [Bradymonadia bacterium]